MEIISETSINTTKLKDAFKNNTNPPTNIEVNINTKNNTSEQQKKEEELIKKWKTRKNKKNTENKHLLIPQELIRTLIQTKDYKGLVLLGEGGIGKTCMTLKSIKSSLEPGDWEYQNGYTTPLALYEFLYKGRNKEVLILDDVEGLFNNQISASILKAALWEVDGQRLVYYNSRSKHMTAPEVFTMKAKLIILCNRIPKNSDIGTRAMLSRTINYEFRLTYTQKMDLCKEFIIQEKMSEAEKIKVISILEQNTSIATKDFNFRTFKKAVAFVKSSRGNAELLFRVTTKDDELKKAYLQSRKEETVKQQVRVFSDLTGCSRATFFRVKKKMMVEINSLESQSLNKKRFETETLSNEVRL